MYISEKYLTETIKKSSIEHFNNFRKKASKKILKRTFRGIKNVAYGKLYGNKGEKK